MSAPRRELRSPSAATPVAVGAIPASGPTQDHPSSTSEQEQSPAPLKIPSTSRIWIAAITLAVSAAFLFVHLNHYALWDDEAVVALIAQGVWQTGDTTALNGNNIVAYRNGLLLKGFKDRTSPPLQYFVVAPFVGLLGPHAWAVRLPMAMMGLACVGMMLWWLWIDQGDLGLWVIFSLALLGDVSFFLYFRQCRYYGIAMFLLTATGLVYTHLQTRRSVILLSIVLLLLLPANYMSYAAGVIMLAIDYVFWGRKRRRLDLLDWAIVILPQILIGSVIIWIWNPASIDQVAAKELWILDRLRLLWWNLRDLAICEYGATLALLAAPVVAVICRQIPLLRATVALAVGIIVLTIVSPQKTDDAMVADVRYLSGLLPLCIAVEALSLRAICGRSVWNLGLPAACVLFGTNLLQGSCFYNERYRPPFQSTVGMFIQELADPPPDPYTATAAWINAKVPSGASILVNPDFMCYPLMFHAPAAIYGWQFDKPVKSIYNTLPSIQFKHRIPPDYIIIFGSVANTTDTIMPGGVVRYSLLTSLDVYGKDVFRPELFFHAFRPITDFDPVADGVRIYKRSRRPTDSR